MSVFTLVYGLLAAVGVFLVVKFARPGIPKDQLYDTGDASEDESVKLRRYQQADAFAY